SSEIVFPLSVKRRGEGIIIQELNPKIAFFRIYSNLDAGDEIYGPDLWGFSSTPVTKINIGQKGRTSSHSGQDVEINGGKCFLQIIQGLLGSAIGVHPKNDLIPHIILPQISSQTVLLLTET
ncbi:MAG: hypothetical protein V1880_01045, partial [Patescibacteria group bacterium]